MILVPMTRSDSGELEQAYLLVDTKVKEIAVAAATKAMQTSYSEGWVIGEPDRIWDDTDNISTHEVEVMGIKKHVTVRHF